MNYRLIAIDLDGTLLCPRGTVTPRIKAAVHGAQAAGYEICFATGRNFTECRTILRDVDHYPICAFVGGAVVMDTKSQRVLHRTAMDPKLAAELCQLFEENGHAALALQDTDAAGVDYLITNRHDVNAATREWMKLTQASYHRDKVDRLGDYHHRHTLRVGIVTAPEEITKVHAIMTDRYHGKITCHRLVIPSYGVEVLEAFDPAVSKWSAIQKIAQSHGIAPTQVIAVGDDLNDLSMIQNAGLGIAMGNAHAEVIACARQVIKCNHEEGLSEFLENLGSSTAEAAA